MSPIKINSSSCKGKKIDFNYFFPYEIEPIWISKNYPIKIPPIDHGRKIQYAWENNAIFLQINEDPRNHRPLKTVLKTYVPWSCKEDDKVRQDLSAYLICLRFHSLGLLGKCTFICSNMDGSILSFKNRKKARSLRTINSDLLNEIVLTDPNTSIPIIDERTNTINTDFSYYVRINDLRFHRTGHNFTMDDVKHQIAEFIFMNYLQKREEKSTHQVDWPNMDWKNLKHVWTSSSYHSVMHIRHLRLLMEHEPCGEILNERKYDPTRWEEWKKDDPLDSFRKPSNDSTIIKPVYHDDKVEFISSLSNSFHCKHCGVFESIEHWAIDCPNNPIDIPSSQKL